MKFSTITQFVLVTCFLCSAAIANLNTTRSPAAVSGYYASASELKAILDSKKVHQRLGSEYRIQSIVSRADYAGNFSGRYDITAPNNNGEICTLNVRVKYMATGKMDLVLAQRSCKSAE